MVLSDEYFMKEALKEAQKAFEEDEVPVGAVIVVNQTIIAKAHNLTERLNDVTAHAEMQAITAASEYLQSKYLNEATLYVTLEPCNMCAGALYWTQIGRIVIGASDSKRGAISTKKELIHPTTEIKMGVMENDSVRLLQTFFQEKRQDRKYGWN